MPPRLKSNRARWWRPVSVTVALALVVGVTVAGAARGGAASTEIRLGGAPLELVAANGSLWVLTCERRCSGQGRANVGRLVRIDPRRARVTASVTVERPGAIAVGAQGVFLTDFWRDTVRRLDAETLRQTATVKLSLPAHWAPKSGPFLPIAVAVEAGAVWVATEWCALARIDGRASRQVALIRLPCDAYQTMGAVAGSVWIGESLAGLYRLDPASNRVVARLQIGPATGRLVPTQLLAAPRGAFLAVGVWTQSGALTTRNALARIDPHRSRVKGITSLPPGALLAATGRGSLWIGQRAGSSVERIDPTSGRVIARFHAQVGTALAFAGGSLWTADPNGLVRRLPHA